MRKFSHYIICTKVSWLAPFGIHEHMFVICLYFILEYFVAGLVHSLEYGRACYSKMVEELSELLKNTPACNLYMGIGCFQTMLNAPVPDDHKSWYLQDAVSVFTEILCRDS
uniref:Uncharacterized protein n=1 Tax=Arundo donax TaxID=35708 RepID=A0A0A9CK72_ARUDO